ncbi:hypothetical protein [Hellea balneolensis]|uniref:hypothetical protein n=1 Tax=Hellea balneolensis TaxID=287478 RepID=UPI0004228972|nr:hypothetical protein [Hellea balneolensis]
MLKFLKRVGAWLAAVFVTVILAVALQTQNIISRLGNLGADIGFGERLSMTTYDISHLGTLYGIFITLALGFAFLAGGLLYRGVKFGRPLIYSVAGGVAMLVLLFAMKEAFFDVHIIAGARDALGISLQILAGALGGWVFAYLTRNLTVNKKAAH